MVLIWPNKLRDWGRKKGDCLVNPTNRQRKAEVCGRKNRVCCAVFSIDASVYIEQQHAENS
jgi:hypothetical protein